MQTAHITVKGGYAPAVVQVPAGSPIRLDFDRQESGECSSHVVFPDLGIDRALPAFDTTQLMLPALAPGIYPFACGMNMPTPRSSCCRRSLQASIRSRAA